MKSFPSFHCSFALRTKACWRTKLESRFLTSMSKARTWPRVMSSAPSLIRTYSEQQPWSHFFCHHSFPTKHVQNLFLFGHRWSYKCMNLLSSLQTKFIGSKYLLMQLNLYNANSDADFYVDVVYIGNTPTTEDENGTRLCAFLQIWFKIISWGFL